MNVVVKGVEGVVRCLEAMRTRQQRELTAAVLAGSMVVQATAVALCPYVTGNLRRSIHQEVADASKTRVLVVIGTDVQYAARVEFGFVDKDKLGRRFNQRPKPYLRPGLERSADKVARDIHVALRYIMRAGAR